MSIKSALTKMHIVEDEQAVSTAAAPTPAIQPQTPAPNYAAMPNYGATPNYGSQLAVAADPDMVAKIKATVFGASPIMKQFMENVERMKAVFPNDEVTQMKAALASTQVDKVALVQELNRTVAAALLHTKSGLENEHNKAHDLAVGPLQQQLNTVTNDITSMQNQIVQLQQTVASRQQNATDLQGQIHTAEANLQQQDNVVKGSYTQVEQYIATLNQAFTKI